MKNEYLIKHLAEVDLSFLRSVKNEVVEQKNKNDVAAIRTKIEHPENWNNDINEMEVFLNEIANDIQPIQLNVFSMIYDVRKFVYSHLEVVKANNGNSIFLPYLHRLQELKTVLTNI